MRRVFARINSVQAALLLLSCLGASLVINRDNLITHIAPKIGATVYSPVSISERECDDEACWIRYEYRLEDSSTYVGFYGFNASACVIKSARARQCDESTAVASLIPNFYKFSTTPIDNRQEGADSFFLLVMNLPNTPRLGSSRPTVFGGAQKSVEGLRTVYELLSVHIYLFQALLFVLIPAFLASSGLFKTREEQTSAFILGSTGAICQLVFSHYFSEFLFLSGFQFDHFLALCRTSFLAFFAYYVLRVRSHSIWVFSLVAYFLANVIDWQFKPILQAYPYRWLVTGLSAYLAFTSVRERNLGKIVCLAFAFNDISLMFNMPWSDGKNSVLALGIFALFIAKYASTIESFIRNNLFAIRKRNLDESLEAIKAMANAPGVTPQDLAHKSLELIAQATNAKRLSLCLNIDTDPLICSFADGIASSLSSGTIPAVFARVIQTREALMWCADDEFSRIREFSKIAQGSQRYNSLSCVIPLKQGDVVYGAFAATSFDDKTLQDQREKDLFIYLSSSALDILIGVLAMREKDHADKVMATAKETRSRAAAACSTSSTFSQAFHAVIEVISDAHAKKSIIFKVNSQKELSPDYFSANFPKAIAERWASIPFVMRQENRLGPMPVAYNEKKPVVIHRIANYFSLLSKMSVDLITESQTSGFYVFPFDVGGQEHLIVFLDADTSVPAGINTEGVRLSLDILGFYHTHFSIKDELSRADNVISRFASSRLLDVVKTMPTSDRILAGQTITSSMFLFDIRGSTKGSAFFDDPEEMARCYSDTYADIADLASSLGARFEKSNGDGIVLTLPGSLDSSLTPLHLLLSAYKQIDSIAKTRLFASGVVAVLHHGTVFQGVFGNSQRIGWENYGRDLNFAFEIEKVAKKIPGARFAISDQFRPALKSIFATQYLDDLLVRHEVMGVSTSFFALADRDVETIARFFALREHKAAS